MIESDTALNRGGATPYPLRDYSGLRGLDSIADSLIGSHVTLYQSSVEKISLLIERLKGMEAGSFDESELHRQIESERHNLKLHELYFENLSPRKSRISQALEGTLDGLWGSFKRWKEEFETTARVPGVGWVILDKDLADGSLSNRCINLQEQSHRVGFSPLLVMDVWEHAFTGMPRTTYVEAFFLNVDWRRVEQRWTNG